MTHFYNTTSIAGFVVIVRDRMWGPFETPDIAAKWAIDVLASGEEWVIKPMLDPEHDKH